MFKSGLKHTFFKGNHESSKTFKFEISSLKDNLIILFIKIFSLKKMDSPFYKKIVGFFPLMINYESILS